MKDFEFYIAIKTKSRAIENSTCLLDITLEYLLSYLPLV